VANALVFKQTATGRPFEAVCGDRVSPTQVNPVNLTLAASATLTLKSKTTTLTLPLTIADAVNGLVRYQWATNDVANDDEFRSEVVVVWSNGKIDIFPAGDYGTVIILPKLS
jgi:hypothetical protein